MSDKEKTLEEVVNQVLMTQVTLTDAECLKLANTVLHQNEQLKIQQEKHETERSNLLKEIDLTISLQGKTKAPLFKEVKNHFRKAWLAEEDKKTAVLALEREKENRKMVEDWRQGLLNNAYQLIKDIHEIQHRKGESDEDFVYDLEKEGLSAKIKEIAEQYNPDKEAVGLKDQGDQTQ